MFVSIVVAIALGGRLVFLSWPFDSDGAMFIYLGKSVCSGDRFCHDVIDNKFPTVGLMTSVLWRVFGTSWAGYVLTQTAMAFAAAAMLARCAARNIGEQAKVPTLLAALVYLNFAPCVFGGFQLETMQIFFAVLSACAAIETLRNRGLADAFLAGLAAGCAALLKPTGVAPLVAMMIVFAIRREGLRSIAASTVGAMLPLSVGMIYIVRTDIAADMPALIRQISEYASQTPLAWEDVLKPLIVLMFAGIAVLIRGWVFRRPAHRQGEWPQSSIVWFAAIWFAIEFAGAIAQRRMYAYHFLPIAAPAALLFGMLPRKVSTFSLATALFPTAAVSLLGSVTLLRSAPNDSTALSDYVRSHTRAADAVWMDNASRLLLETDRRLGSRYPLMFVFGNTDTFAGQHIGTLIDDLSIRRPALVILPSDVERRIRRDQQQTLHLLRSPRRSEAYANAWREIASYVRANYIEETRIEDQAVWRRK